MDAVKTTFSHYPFQSPCQNYLPISISTTLPQGGKDRKASCGPYTPDNTLKQAITPPCVKSKARLHALPCNSSTRVPTRESIATKESPAAVGRWIQSSNHAFNDGSSIVCHGCISQLPKSISIPYGPWKSAEICQTRTSAQWTGIYGIGPTEGIRSKPLCDRFGLLFEISSQRHIGPSVTDPLRHRNRRMSYTNQLHHPSQYNAAKAR